MGVKESTGEKGLFPANFTRPIWKYMWNVLKRCIPTTISRFFYKRKKIENIYIYVKRVSLNF